MLNPDGIGLNPINNKEYSDKYRKLSTFWTKLPSYSKAKEIINSIIKNQVVLISSGTGSGKTVMIPRYALESCDYKCKIGVTLPKQILTVSSASFQADILDVELGKDVGYVYKGSDRNYIKDTNILVYATDGTIVSKLLKDPELREFNCIIIDEAHERKVQIDFLLYLLKQTCIMRPDFKLIIMSATINEHIFINYFKDFKFDYINISGQTNYPIKSIYLEKQLLNQSEYINIGIEIIKSLEKKQESGDILFFVTSVQDTKDVCKILSDIDSIYCVEIYSGVNKEKQKIAQEPNLYKQTKNKTRKVVIATNVAESSLTIDNIKFVIDSGLELFNYYDFKKDSSVLTKKLITKAQVRQRMGRTGRTSEGICYHLYTLKQFEQMEDYPSPSIQTSNIYEECLKLMNIDTINTTNNVKKILKQFIEPPLNESVSYAFNKLTKLGLIKNNELTKLGRIVSDMNVSPEKGIAIIIAYNLNCMREVVMIISLQQVTKNNISELFFEPVENVKFVDPIKLNRSDMGKINTNNQTRQINRLIEKFTNAKNKLMHKSGDHISLLKIMKKYIDIRNKKSSTWIYDNFLKESVLDKAYNNYKKIYYTCKQKLDGLTKIEINHDIKNEYDKILTCFIYGIEPINIAHYTTDKYYLTTNNEKVKITKESWINIQNNKDKIKIVLFDELFTFDDKTHMVMVSILTQKIIKFSNTIQSLLKDY